MGGNPSSECCLPLTGEGSFGRVLQAKADGIVPGMPDRNVVAIKTTKGIYTCCTCIRTVYSCICIIMSLTSNLT